MDWCNANIGIGNDYIEEAIQEARKEGAIRRARRGRPRPYSLKSPSLHGQSRFLGQVSARGNPTSPYTRIGRFDDGDTLQCGLDSRVHADVFGSCLVAGDAAEKVKAAFKQSKSKDGSLPFGLSSFLGSLSTLTGSFSSYMLSLLDTPAYAMLSTRYMNEVFNPRTPNVSGVKYYSVASRTPSLAIWHPLWLQS